MGRLRVLGILRALSTDQGLLCGVLMVENGATGSEVDWKTTLGTRCSSNSRRQAVIGQWFA
jgi:hypothetical protein